MLLFSLDLCLPLPRICNEKSCCFHHTSHQILECTDSAMPGSIVSSSVTIGSSGIQVCTSLQQLLCNPSAVPCTGVSMSICFTCCAHLWRRKLIPGEEESPDCCSPGQGQHLLQGRVAQPPAVLFVLHSGAQCCHADQVC